MGDDMKVGFWRAGHGGSLTVAENREHDAACDGHGRCTWQRPSEEPHHAAARELADGERSAVQRMRERAIDAQRRTGGRR